MIITILENGDTVCEHGTALDVHCCNCHSGFLFYPDECVCLGDKMNRVVIYHGNCFDGMASAWAAWKKFKDGAIYIPAYYNQPFPPIAEKSDAEVYIVDFSYPREELLRIKKLVCSLTVLDHHKTAQKDLEGLDFCIFDMEHSGAYLAWEYFHQQSRYFDVGGNEVKDLENHVEFPTPTLIKYIEDRDLWRFSLDGSNYINAYIQSWPMSIESYDNLYRDLESVMGFDEAWKSGESIERYKNTMVDAQCKQAVVSNIGGYEVPIVNSTILFSEVGNELCKRYPNAKFSAYYTIRGDGKKQFGLRSIGEFDVSEVAKKYGGGGHFHAAGFTID